MCACACACAVRCAAVRCGGAVRCSAARCGVCACARACVCVYLMCTYVHVDADVDVDVGVDVDVCGGEDGWGCWPEEILQERPGCNAVTTRTLHCCEQLNRASETKHKRIISK